jgi:hypothetical protein
MPVRMKLLRVSPSCLHAALLACRLACLSTGLATCLASCAAPPADVDPASGLARGGSPVGWREGACADGVHTVAWRPIGGGGVPRNREFDVEVRVSVKGAPRSVQQLAMGGWMPEHHHGLVQLPAVHELAPGNYRVDGMLLHMRGRWQVRVSFVVGGASETVTFDLDL